MRWSQIAMEEDWDVCVAHIECITGIIGEVIAQGVASGEFEAPDLPLAALCTCTGMIRFFHPQMIAAGRQQAHRHDRPDGRFPFPGP